MVRVVPLPTITDDSALGGAVIEKSLRFNDDDSAYLSRTPSSAGNRKTFTISAWVKRCSTGGVHPIFSRYTANSDAGFLGLYINSDDYIYFTGWSTVYLKSSRIYRDPTAWSHILLAVDTTQSTSTDRIKLYFNGELQSTATYNAPSQNADLNINEASAEHMVGRYSTNYFDGYLAEVNFIDGQALGPEYFGFTEFQTGAWKPRGYYGSYGTNGFRLDFSDNSSTTTLGIDKSPNGNDYTTNNFSVSSGKDGDSFIDTPTNNFPTLNPLVGSTTAQSLSDGNLTRAGGARKCIATFEIQNGKYYFEYRAEDGNQNHGIGVCQINTDQRDRINTEAAHYFGNGEYKIENNSQTSGFASYTTGDIIGVAIDTTLSTPKVWFAKNNTWQGTGNPTTTGYSLTSDKKYVFSVDHTSGSGSSAGTAFFGAHQGEFNYDPPSGFKALSSKNLPKPTTPIINPDQHFKALLYTGTGSSNIVEGLNFTPDMVWVKGRDTNGYEHMIIDSVRGGDKSIVPNSADPQSTHGGRSMTFYNRGVRWNSDSGNCNANGENYVLWCWKGGGTAVSNNDGSVTSTISANQEAGFSIVQFESQSSGDITVGHGLGRKPAFWMWKSIDNTIDWYNYHKSIGYNGWINLSTTSQATTGNDAAWKAEPTSTVLTHGSGLVNQNTIIMYVWAEIPGFSRFGSYVGNGNADGPFVHCGFRPAFVLTKMIDTMNENWTINDSSRSTYNPVDLFLRPDEAVMDTSGAATMDFCAEGFKLRNTDDKTNRDGGTFIFMAFAEQSPVTPYDEFTNAR